MRSDSIHKKARRRSGHIYLIYFLIAVVVVAFALVVTMPPKKVIEKAPELEADSTKSQVNPEAHIDSAIYAIANCFGSGKDKVRINPKRDSQDILGSRELSVTVLVSDVFPLPIINKKAVEKISGAGGEIIDAIENNQNELKIRIGINKVFLRSLTIRRQPKIKPTPVDLALVIDDFGLVDSAFAEEFFAIPYPFTAGIIPFCESSPKWLQIAKESGKEYIVHMPMEPVDYQRNDPGKNAIFSDLPEKEIRKRIALALASLPGATGISNHMGSKITADRRIMTIIFSEIKDKGIFFLDSRTTVQTVCKEIGNSMRVKVLVITHCADAGDIEAPEISSNILKMGLEAREKGGAILNLHATQETLKALKDALPILSKWGIRFVTLSELANKKEE